METKPKAKQEEKKDASVFKGKPYIRGAGLKSWAESDGAYKATNLSQAERTKIVQELFGKEDYFYKREAEGRLTKLRGERYRAKTDAERKKLDKKITVTETILGK
jgi:hypothetical protein